MVEAWDDSRFLEVSTRVIISVPLLVFAIVFVLNRRSGHNVRYSIALSTFAATMSFLLANIVFVWVFLARR